MAGSWAGGPRADDGPVVLKTREAAVGHRYKTTATVETVVQITAGGENVEAVDKTVRLGSRTEFTDEVLECAGDRKRWPFKLKRTFQAAEATSPDGAIALRLAGREVTIVGKEDGAVELEATGVEPLGVEAEGVVRGDFSHPKTSIELHALLPDRPLAAGDTWPLDLPKFFAICPDNMARDEGAATGTGTLVERSTKSGRAYARFELAADIPLTKQRRSSPSPPS